MLPYRKTMTRKVLPTRTATAGTGKMSFTVSTARVDRDNDTIDPLGWDLAAFRQNPVVLWAHDHSQPPVARCTSIWATPHALKAEVEFPPRGIYPFADQVHDLVKNGFLHATSVGFRPIEAHANPSRGGTDFVKQELQEFSVVSIPSNPEALVQTRRNGLRDAARFKSWIEAGHEAVDLTFVADGREAVELDFAIPGAQVEVDEELLRQGLQQIVSDFLITETTRQIAVCLRRMAGRVD